MASRRWLDGENRGVSVFGITCNLLAAEDTLQQIYETIADKMVKYENAPRPGGG